MSVRCVSDDYWVTHRRSCIVFEFGRLAGPIYARKFEKIQRGDIHALRQDEPPRVRIRDDLDCYLPDRV